MFNLLVLFDFLFVNLYGLSNIIKILQDKNKFGINK